MFVCRGALSCLFVIQVILCHTGIGTLTLCVSCERCHGCAQALSYLCIMREVSYLCVKQELPCFYVILNVSCLCHVLVFFTCYAKSSCLRVMQVSHLFIYHAGVVFVSESCRRCHAVVYHSRDPLPVSRVGGVLSECHEGVMRTTGTLMRKGGQSKDSSRRELRRKFAEGVSGDEGSFGLHGGVEILCFPLVLVLMLILLGRGRWLRGIG